MNLPQQTVDEAITILMSCNTRFLNLLKEYRKTSYESAGRKDELTEIYEQTVSTMTKVINVTGAGMEGVYTSNRHKNFILLLLLLLLFSRR